MKKLLILSILIFSFEGFSNKKSLVEFLKTKKELSCRFIGPIKYQYLMKHIKYSSYLKDFSKHKRDFINLNKKIAKSYIDFLDPAKIYFTRKEERFLLRKIGNILTHTSFYFKNNRIVFKNQKADCAKIHVVYNLFKKNLKQRTDFSVKLLKDKNFKFIADTEINLSSKRKRFPSKKALESFYRKYLQFQVSHYLSPKALKDKKLLKKELKKARKNVSKSYLRIFKRFKEYKEKDILRIYLNAFSEALDPHSAYLSREDMEDFHILMRLSLEGIGATLGSEDGFTVIKELVVGGAADKTGKVKIDDKIIAVAQGKKGAFENIIEMDLNDVVRKIRGKKGTLVRLKILRKTPSGMKRFVVPIVRDKIKLQDRRLKAYYLKRKKGNKSYLISVINVPSFYSGGSKTSSSVTEDLKKALFKISSKKVDGIILDLSKNGGGSLDEAVKFAGAFIYKGNIVKQSFPANKFLTLEDNDERIFYKGPLVVLVSRISASASEIVAGSLKSYKRALIVGSDHTYGKGSVQSVEPLPWGLGALKTTIGLFFISSGHSTQRIGVSSDVFFPDPFSYEEIGEKTKDYVLKAQSIKSFNSKKAISGMDFKLTSWLIKKLQKRSKKRVSKDKKFKEITEELNKKKKNKTFKVSYLMKEQKKQEKEDKKQARMNKKQKREKYLSSPNVKESIQILIDYLSFAGFTHG